MTDKTTRPALTERVTPEMREQIERYMGDRMRCMPSERLRLEAEGFTAKERDIYV